LKENSRNELANACKVEKILHLSMENNFACHEIKLNICDDVLTQMRWKMGIGRHN
jgi:hypothetical protein